MELDDYFSDDPEILNDVAKQPNNFYKSNGSYGNKNTQGKKSFYQKKEIDLATFSLYKPYTVTGNAGASNEVCNRLKEILDMLDPHGFTPRISCMSDFDTIVENELKGTFFEMYIPWKDFNNKVSKHYFNDNVSKHVAKMFHKSFDSLKPAIQAFLAKNVRMVLGDKLKTYSLFVLIWSEDGAEQVSDITFKTGNMGHVISVARALHIPVFNLQHESTKERLAKYLKLKQSSV